VLSDFRTAPIDAKRRALLAFIEKVNARSDQVRPADVEEAKAAGWSDEALYDAITVCALFRFYNTWVDATGVKDMSVVDYQASGQRLATMGYAPPP
jgi:alkylhydroperoxidase family enzyme